METALIQGPLHGMQDRLAAFLAEVSADGPIQIEALSTVTFEVQGEIWLAHTLIYSQGLTAAETMVPMREVMALYGQGDIGKMVSSLDDLNAVIQGLPAPAVAERAREEALLIAEHAFAHYGDDLEAAAECVESGSVLLTLQWASDLRVELVITDRKQAKATMRKGERQLGKMDRDSATNTDFFFMIDHYIMNALDQP